MLYAPLHFKNYEKYALRYTGVVQSATSKNELKKMQFANHDAILKELAIPEFRNQIIKGNLVTGKKQVVLKFFIARRVFQKKI